jgi:hypothetical protein
LIAYGRTSSKIWKAVNTSGSVPAKTRKEESDYLDFQIQQWLQAIPPELQLLHPKADDNAIQATIAAPAASSALRAGQPHANTRSPAQSAFSNKYS